MFTKSFFFILFDPPTNFTSHKNKHKTLCSFFLLRKIESFCRVYTFVVVGYLLFVFNSIKTLDPKECVH